MEIVSQYGLLILTMCQIVLAIMVLYLRGKFASKETEAAVSKVETRVTAIENRLEQIPTKEDLHNLNIKICELMGDLKRVDENLEGVEKMAEILQKQYNRMDDFLKRVK